MIINRNLTQSQSDFAVFLPAISSFYSTFIGKQQVGNYVDPARIPVGLTSGVESLNWFNPAAAEYEYHWSLYSAGHANLDVAADVDKERMISKRNRNTSWLLGDSGGFQIGKGVWDGDWKNPSCPRAQQKREQVLHWMDSYMDYGMILDIPAWVARSDKGKQKTGINNYQQAVDATKINNDYFMANRTGACKFLNVLQGEDHTEAQMWYDQMKHYCDPNQFPKTHFDGWAMGGQNMCDPHLLLKRIVYLKWEGLLEKGVHDWMHFLGTSKLEWAVLLTDVQRAVRQFHNPNFTISFDCASPFLATANGKVYYDINLQPLTKWSYRIDWGPDHRKYSTDTRPYSQVSVQDGFYKKFEQSPISQLLKINDICVYAPGQLNKNGKESKTSWDSFSYALLMAHNVWMHLEAVQRANRAYDQGMMPKMLIDLTTGITWRNLVFEALSAPSLDAALAVVDKYDKFYSQILGTRGTTGANTKNGRRKFIEHFGELAGAELEAEPEPVTVKTNLFDKFF